MNLVVVIASAGLLFSASHLFVMPNGVAEANQADASKGRKIFVKYCSGCHGAQGQGDGYRLLGPEPANLGSSSTQEQSDEELLFTIHQGKPNMPAWKFQLSSQDSRDVLAYIRSLPREQSQ